MSTVHQQKPTKTANVGLHIRSPVISEDVGAVTSATHNQ